MQTALGEDRLDFMDKCSAAQFSAQFRSPITEVLLQYPLLLKHTDEKGCEVAYSIENSMYQLLRNVKNIELYSSLEKTHFTFEILDIVELVHCVRDAVNTVSKIKIGVSACPGPIYVEGNRAIQIHALLGLIRNAMTYTQDEYSINLFMEATLNRVIIKVCDIGKGIKEEYQNQVFEPFFSVNPYGDEAEEPGLGLDLAILDRLLQHLGGSRPVATSEFGEGNAIAFSIPFIMNAAEIDAHSIKKCDLGELLTNRFSSLYLQLSGFCRYPE